MKTTKRVEVSRREFLKWSALAGTGAVIASCAPAPAAEPAEEAAADTGRGGFRGDTDPVQHVVGDVLERLRPDHRGEDEYQGDA